MRRVRLAALAFGCCLAAASPALALPHLSRAENRRLTTLVNRWVNDVVLRKNLADGWSIAGPDLRGGTTRRAWVAGRALPIQYFPLVGTDFRKSWYVQWKTPTEMGLVVSLRSGRGKNAEMIQEQTGLVRHGGHWVINAFYANGIFRLGKGHRGSCASSKCEVTGLNDYAAGAPASSLPSGTARLGKTWLLVGLGALGLLVVAIPLGIGLRVRSRNRRALAEYLGSRSA
jgi:hypothetical protein